MTDQDRQVRRARSTVVIFANSSPVVWNFVAKRLFHCNADAIGLLAACQEWRTVGSLAELYRDYDRDSLIDSVNQLVEYGGLVVFGSAEAGKDEEYSKVWEWREPAGLYHFAIRDTRYFAGEEAVAALKSRKTRQPPPLYLTNDGYPDVHRLQPPDPGNAVFGTMLRRRSERGFAAEAIKMEQLGDCLFSGLAITAFMDEPVLGRLPLKPTPSGGARNPYEAFVFAFNVEGLSPGIYHYSASEHSLAFVSPAKVTGADLLGGQEWAASAAAVIVLVAYFERTMWKYPHPTGYRVVLVEAGHIGQNIALAATVHRLAATPTAALSESAIERAIGLDSLVTCPIYAVALGVARAGSKRWFDVMGTRTPVDRP